MEGRDITTHNTHTGNYNTNDGNIDENRLDGNNNNNKGIDHINGGIDGNKHIREVMDKSVNNGREGIKNGHGIDKGQKKDYKHECKEYKKKVPVLRHDRKTIPALMPVNLREGSILNDDKLNVDLIDSIQNTLIAEDTRPTRPRRPLTRSDRLINKAGIKYVIFSLFIQTLIEVSIFTYLVYFWINYDIEGKIKGNKWMLGVGITGYIGSYAILGTKPCKWACGVFNWLLLGMHGVSFTLILLSIYVYLSPSARPLVFQLSLILLSGYSILLLYSMLIPLVVGLDDKRMEWTVQLSWVSFFIGVLACAIGIVLWDRGINLWIGIGTVLFGMGGYVQVWGVNDLLGPSSDKIYRGYKAILFSRLAIFHGIGACSDLFDSLFE